MSDLYIIRGIAGSGKTTLAQKMMASGLIDAYFEADHYRVNADGEYVFSPSKNGECHDKCFADTVAAINSGKSVAVSNTFVRVWEMQRYLDLDCRKTVIRCEGKFQNVHGVPKSAVERMAANFEDYNDTP